MHTYPKSLKELKLVNTALLFIELKDNNKDDIINNIGDHNFKIIKLIKREGDDIVLLRIEIELNERSCKKMMKYVEELKNKTKAVRCKIGVNVKLDDVKPIKDSSKYRSNYLETMYKIEGDNREIDIKDFVDKINRRNRDAHLGVTLDPSDETYFLTKQCHNDRMGSAHRCIEKVKETFDNMGGVSEVNMHYVWYDDNKKMDEGWCDKTDIEEELISDDDMYDDNITYRRMRNHIDTLIKIQKLYGSEDNVNN